MSEYTPYDHDMRAIYLAYSLDFSDERRQGENYIDGVKRCEAEFDRWLAERDRKVVLDERDRVSNILSDRSKFWSNESKREDINLKQREHCEDRAEILSNAIALIVWNNEGINNV